MRLDQQLLPWHDISASLLLCAAAIYGLVRSHCASSTTFPHAITHKDSRVLSKGCEEHRLRSVGTTECKSCCAAYLWLETRQFALEMQVSQSSHSHLVSVIHELEELFGATLDFSKDLLCYGHRPRCYSILCHTDRLPICPCATKRKLLDIIVCHIKVEMSELHSFCRSSNIHYCSMYSLSLAMNPTEVIVVGDASSRLALAAHILTIIAALLQLITLSVRLCQRLQVHKGEALRSIDLRNSD